MDTVSRLLKRYLAPIGRHFARKMKETRGDEGDGTVLPDTLMADEALKGFGTVEKLAEGYKASNAKTFIDFLPAEARSDPSITKYKTGEEMFKGHKSLVEMIGKKGVTIPADGAPQEDFDKYFNSLGRPEKAEGYQFTKVEDLHPEVKTTPETEKGFKDILHKIGVSNKQADALNNIYLSRISAAMVKRDQDNEETLNQGTTALKNEWGDKYNENITLAQRLIKVFGGDETLKDFGDLGLRPNVLKFLAGLGRKLSEDSFKHVGGIDLLADAGAAKRKITEISSKIMSMKQGDPGYDELVKERTRLYTVAHPEGGEK